MQFNKNKKDFKSCAYLKSNPPIYLMCDPKKGT